MKDVVIVSAMRTPIGSFLGSLSTVPAPELGAIAVKAVIEKSGIDPKEVQEVFFGNVLQAGIGQSPARQVTLKAGLSEEIPSTTINKVCSSGMKSIMFAVQSILAGENEVVIAGGMESMSLTPSYLQTNRTGVKLGDQKLVDGILRDGLINVYDGKHMGNCAESCAKEFNISREEQDKFAIESYRRSAEAWKEGRFTNEVVPVSIPQRKGDPIIVSKDEEYENVNIEKIPTLRPAFEENGTVTAANASTINDGAAALLIMSADKAKELGLKPLAKILSYADAAVEPEKFTTAPAKALPLALKKANLDINDIDYFELNEAFAVVGIANSQILNLDPSKVNVNGGAVSIGHPLGCSGARIMVTLVNVLQQKNAKLGAAAVCNGGGGASAMIIERL